MYKLLSSMIVIFLMHISPLMVPFSQTESRFPIEEHFYSFEIESTGNMPSYEEDPILNKKLLLQIKKEQLAAVKPSQVRPLKFAALTFDDGPSEYTPQVLAVLKKYKIQATFFVLGSQAKKNPELIRQMQAEGHVIGNHTWDHKDLTRLTAEDIQREIQSTNQLLKEILGQEVQLFRPPYGNLNANVRASIQEKGLKPVLWNVDPADWNLKKTSPISERVQAGIKDHSLILLHDGGGPRGSTVESLPVIIQQLQQDGFEFVTAPVYLSLIEQPSI